MRIRRRPPQIPPQASSDPPAGGGSSSGSVAVVSAAGSAVGIGEITIGTGGLHPSIEARGKGERPWGGDSVSLRLGQPVGGGRGGGWTGGGSAASYREVQQPQQQQKRHKGKAAEEEDGVRGADEESKEEKDQKPGAAHPEAGAHKTWNHVSAGGAAANGLGAEAFVTTTGPAPGSHSELASAARRTIVWSSGSSRSAKSPSSSSSSVKTETSNGGGSTSYMLGGDRQLVKDEEEKKREGKEEDQQLVNGRGDNTSNNKNKNNNSGKRRRSPAVLMEGSRCSRVNGRGWRCGQQTLVGYSLCEHHLGKGRLRSVSSVRCKKAAGSAAGKQLIPSRPFSAVQQLHDKQRWSMATLAVDEDEEEETKPSVGARRGKRIGIVKARSMSSLLGQTSSDVVDHVGAVQEAVAPMRVPTATSAGLPTALLRAPVESSTLATAAAAAATPFPPPTAAPKEGIGAVM